MRQGLTALATITLAAAPAMAAANWLTTIDATGTGVAIGNPAAKVQLVQTMSYTCAECGRFARVGSGALDIYVATGKVRHELRPVIAGPPDLTAAMIAQCGPAAKFPRNHAALMAAQARWLPLAERASPAQRSRWNYGPGPARRRAVASDLRLYDIMAVRGYERVEIDTCLADEPLARRIIAQSPSGEAQKAPGFSVDGMPLPGVTTWRALQPQLDARL